MAPMFDTVGWFARDLATLSHVTDVMLPPVQATTDDAQRPSCVIIPTDCFVILGSVDDHTYEILNATATKIVDTAGDAVDNSNLREFVSSNVLGIGKFMNERRLVCIIILCAGSLRHLPRYASPPKRNNAVRASKSKCRRPLHRRMNPPWMTFKSALAALLMKDGILAIPTVPGAPPKLRMEAALLEDLRARTFSLLSNAGLGVLAGQYPAGHPRSGGVLVSVLLLAWHDADRFLIVVAQDLHEALRAEVPVA